MPLNLSDQQLVRLFQSIMEYCKAQRKRNTNFSSSEMAKRLKLTPNYFSAFESGKTTPSIGVFLKYLDLVGFNLEILLQLPLKSKTESKGDELLKEINVKLSKLDDDQIQFVFEQIKIAELINVKFKRIK